MKVTCRGVTGDLSMLLREFTDRQGFLDRPTGFRYLYKIEIYDPECNVYLGMEEVEEDEIEVHA